ncbi:rhodanese-related sulfurtransferase [Prochlorococcus marinus]|uniref:oxygen-dependent tRNA uridine(34) hydroxylase TrhO n=1 Tax=Prochlorococcus marinus TaxID=1219 RepID=UPI0022B3DEFC|nr:rhodanese-related sulfurtransferase [Prochlorococcus marinus]
MKTEDSLKKFKYKVAAFYNFISIIDQEILLIKEELTNLATNQEIKGTILLACEGVNGTVCGTENAIVQFIETLEKLLKISDINVKYSWSEKQAFRRFKARKKKEIVTIGLKQINPTKSVGKYIKAGEWNEFLEDPNTVVIDTRNEYEIKIGNFEGALNPHTSSFREFPAWVQKHLKPLIEENPSLKIGMYCTGGIRCEKATSYLIEEGFPEVHHLEGGILKYLEDVPLKNSLWNGECFVFDQRVSLDHELLPGSYRMCHACGLPISPEDIKKTTYIKGLQCEACVDKFTDSDRARFAERQRQIDVLMKRLPENSIWPSS